MMEGNFKCPGCKYKTESVATYDLWQMMLHMLEHIYENTKS